MPEDDAPDYRVLPVQVRREDMRVVHEVRTFDDAKTEWDRETEFLLRTCGIF
jgi:hypothetical protein